MKKQQAQGETLLLGQLAAAVSIASFFYSLRHGQLLLYGDAVAHINIARRVFDSQTPGPLQLGTVWLPLPHLMMLPFLISTALWQTGIGGSIPSLFAFVLSVSGIFRLVRDALASFGSRSSEAQVPGEARFAAWLAAAIFGLNPNLIYLQTTAMTEPIYLALFIWSVVFFVEGLRACANSDAAKGNQALVRAGLCLMGACLTRYDGWFLAAVMIAVIIALVWIGNFRALRSGAKKLILLAAAGPALWLAYNAAVYRNPLEFANGPYSARAIEQRTSTPGTPPHPGTNDLSVAFKYFFKSAELNLAPGELQILWAAALLLGTAVALLFQRKLWPLLVLWAPVPFHMISIAHGGVPLFVPSWWPFSYYNVRYGTEMLPAFAAFTAVTAWGLMRFVMSRRSRLAVAMVMVAFVSLSYAEIFRSSPASLEEAKINSRSRVALENQLTSILLMLPRDSSFLMYLGDHVGAFQKAAIPLSHVINEGNHRPWKQPSDPDGLWERALRHPAQYSEYVIAFDSDMTAARVNQKELETVAILRVTGQPQTTIYRTRKSNQAR
jgi:hypothetical protein